MNTVKAAVIGAGFGGLALAIRLQTAGFQTVLFEARDKPGGRAYVYEDDGFIFDAGPTVVTDPDCLDELFAVSGKRLASYLEMIPIKPFYRLYWEDGYSFDYGADRNSMEQQIRAKNPADVAGYAKLLHYSKAVLNEGYIKLGTHSFLNFSSMLKVAPQLLRLESYHSVYSIVSRFIKDGHLRQAFSFNPLLIGGNPFNSSSIYLLVHALEQQWGVTFPKGGMGALIKALATLFQELGGELKLSTAVSEITTRNNRATGVRTDDGYHYKCDAVASNADVVFTYERLLQQTPRGRNMGKALKKKSFSPSLFIVYFGTKGNWPNLQHHNIMFGSRYRELLHEIFTGSSLPDDFSLYLHAPTSTDPQLAPPGCSTFYALAPVPHLGNAPIDWSVVGPQYKDKILNYLEQRYMPGLSGRIITTRIFTPEDFRTELGAHLGSAFSLEPVLTQSAWFRPHNKDSKIKGLYFAGAGTHPGAGIPGVVGSAKATSRLMLSDYGMSYPAADRSAELAKKPLQHG